RIGCQRVDRRATGPRGLRLRRRGGRAGGRGCRAGGTAPSAVFTAAARQREGPGRARRSQQARTPADPVPGEQAPVALLPRHVSLPTRLPERALSAGGVSPAPP